MTRTLEVGGGSSIKLYTERAAQSLTSAGQTIVVTDGSPVTLLTSTGNFTMTSVPTIANGRDGQVIILINAGANTITLQDMGTLGGSNLRLGDTTRALAPLRGSIQLIYDTTMSGWIEQYFNNVLTFTPSISGFTIDGGSALVREVAAASTGDATPAFVISYVGVASTASIDIDAGGGEENPGDYPITLPSPFTALNSGTTPPSLPFFKGSSVGQVRTFTVTATVSGTAGLTRTCTVTYFNSRYGGINTQATALSSAQTVALGAEAIDNNKTGSFTANATAGNYFWHCYRSALGQIANDVNGFPCFSVAGQRAGFVRVGTGTVSVTNASGFVETFEQYRSISTGLGNLTVAALAAAANNRIYMGPSTDAGPITNAEILALDDTSAGTSNLNSTVAGSYNVTISGSNYLWFCHPASIPDLTTIKDHSTGFGVAGSYRANVSHTNDYGYTETYRCWRSDNVGIFPTGQQVDVT